MSCCRILVAMIFFLLLPVSGLLQGQETNLPDENNPESYQFRRIFFPEERLKEVIMNFMADDRYCPIPAATFQQWIALTQNQDHAHEEGRIISSIHLSASFEEGQIVDGKGTLQLTAGESEETQMLFLESFGLAVSSPRWADGSEAKLGLLSRGGVGLQISPHDDTLNFDWSMRGKTNSQDSIQFDFELPPSPSIELVIDIPHDMKPTMPGDFGGLIRQIPEGAQPLKENYRRWQIIFGSQNRSTLQLLYDEVLMTPQQQIAMRQTNQYEVSLRGLTLQTVFTFENVNTPLGEILLVLDSPLRPIQLEYNGEPISWSKSALDEEMLSESVRIRAVLPATVSNPHELRLTTFCPVTMDQLWKLPRVRLSSNRMFWMETRTQIHVIHPLKPQSIQSPQWRETSPMAGLEFSENEIFAFQAFHPDAQISVNLSFDPPRLLWHCGTMIEWTAQEVSSKMVIDLSVTEGTVRQLNMELDADWSLDTLHAAQQSRIVDFFTHEKNAGVDGKSFWTIQLNQPIDPQNPLRLFLNARCPRSAITKNPISETQQATSPQSSLPTLFYLDDLVPVGFQHGKQGKCLLALDNKFQYNVSPPESNFQEIRERFETVPSGVIFPLDSFPGVPVTVEPISSTCQLNVTTRIVVNKDSLEQICHFTCIPQNNSRLSQLQVQFTPSASGPLWIWSDTLQPSETSHIQATPISDDDADRWLITTSVPRSTSFEFYAKRTIPFHDLVEVSLPVFQNQENVSAFVCIESRDSLGYQLHKHQMFATPVSLETSQAQHVRAFYGYRPDFGEIHSLKMEPTRSRQQILQLSCIWSMVIQTRHDSIGNTINHVVYSLENRGIDRLEVTLPPGVDTTSVHAIWIDGQRSSWHAEPSGKQMTITIPLLEKKRFSLIELEYFLKTSPLNTTTIVSPMVPEVNIPVISQSWIAWFAPIFHAYPNNSKAKSPRFFSDLITSSSLDAFNLTKWHHWFFERQLKEKLLKISQKIINAIDAPTQTYPVSPPLSTVSPFTTMAWKELLKIPQYTPKNLLIDETSLSRIGIFASGTVSLESGAMKAFEQSGLVWVFDDDNTLLLTSNLLMAQLRDYSTPIFGDRFYHYKGAGLQAYLASMPKPHRVVTVAQWEKISFQDNIPWSCPESLIRFESATPLWNAYEQHWEEGSPPSLVIVYKNRILACQYLSFLLVVVLTWPRRFAKTWVYFLLFLVIFFALFLLPAWWHDIVYGLFWGMICSLAFALVRISREPARRKIRLLKRVDFPNRDSSDLSPVTKSLVFLVLFFAQPWIVQANEPASPPSSSFVPYHVYVPFQQESGDVAEYYYIPDKFYRRLYQVYQNSRFSQHNWQITSARYQGTLINDTLFNLKATLNIELPDQSCVFRLPPMPLRPDGANLDKQPIQGALDPKTQEHIFEISGKGSHQLELILSPKVNDDQLTKHFEIPIPPVSDATLELTFPYEVPPVQIRNLNGRISSKGGTLIAELGPVNSLIVSWPSEITISNQTHLNATQLLHLKALPNQVDLKTMFKFHIPKGRRNQILLAVDPRFQLSGKYRCNDIVIDHETDAKRPGFHRILIDPTISGEAILQADYILNNFSGGIFSGIGQVLAPRFSIVDAKTHRSWLGISIDPSLEVTIPESSIVSRAFKDSWGKMDENIDYAYDLNHLDPTWVMQIRQKPIHFSAAIEQKLLFQLQKAVSETKIQTSSMSETYHLSVTTPKQFQLDQVRVRDEKGILRETPRAVHAEEMVTLFFKRPLVGNMEVIFNGEIPYGLNHSMDFPRFLPEGGEIVSQQVKLYRDFSVLVDPRLQNDSYELTGIPTNETEQDDFLMRSTTSPLYELKVLDQEKFQSSTLLIHPNQPEITGSLISQIDQNLDNGLWENHVTLDLHITQGTLDQLRISYPPEIIRDTPSLIESPAFTIDSNQQSQGLLCLKPSQNFSLNGYQKIKINFPLKGNSDSALLKPIKLLNHRHVKHYVALVTQVPMKKILWSVSHLEPVPEIPGFVSEPSVSAFQKQFEHYRATADDYKAEISIRKNHPVVLCHDVSLFLAKNDDCYGISYLDIQNHENSTCILKLPESGRLLQIKTGEITVIPEKIDDQRYRIDLWPSMPVQRIEVFFAMIPAMDNNLENQTLTRQHFPLPVIENVPLERLFWSFYMEQKNETGHEERFLQLRDSDGRTIIHDEKQDISLYRQGVRFFRSQMNLLRLHNNLELFQRFPLNRDTTNRELRDMAFLREKEWKKTFRETELLCAHNDINASRNALVLTTSPTPLFQSDTQNDKNLSTNIVSLTKDLMPYLLGIEQPNFEYLKELDALYSELPFNKNRTPVSDVEKHSTTYEPDTASLFFGNQADHFMFVGGVSSLPITEITLVLVPHKTRFYEKNLIKHITFLLVVVGLLGICNMCFFRNVFIASPVFFVVAIAVLTIVLTNQQFLGWSVILLLVLAVYWPLLSNKRK